MKTLEDHGCRQWIYLCITVICTIAEEQKLKTNSVLPSMLTTSMVTFLLLPNISPEMLHRGKTRCNQTLLVKSPERDYNSYVVIQFITLFIPQEFPQCGEGLDVQESVSWHKHIAHWRPFFVALIKRIPDLRVNAKDCWRERNSRKIRPWHLMATIHCDSPCLPACFSLRLHKTSKACQNHLQVKALLTYSTNCNHNSEQMEFPISKKFCSSAEIRFNPIRGETKGGVHLIES